MLPPPPLLVTHRPSAVPSLPPCLLALSRPPLIPLLTQVVVCEGIVLEKCCPLPVIVVSEKDNHGAAGTTGGTAYDGTGAGGGTSYGTSGGAYGAGGGSTYGGDSSSSSYDSSSYGMDKDGKKMMKKKKPVVIVKPLVCEVSGGWDGRGRENDEGDENAGGPCLEGSLSALVCGGAGRSGLHAYPAAQQDAACSCTPMPAVLLLHRTPCLLPLLLLPPLPPLPPLPSLPPLLPPQVVVKEVVPVKAHFFL